VCTPKSLTSSPAEAHLPCKVCIQRFRD
jgi:hypothetical protein